MFSGFSWFTGHRRNPSRAASDDAGEPGPSNYHNENLKRKEPDSDDSSDKPAKKQKYERCGICLERMKLPEEVMSTPCAHVFCTLCLLTSYEYSKKCPLCRLPIKEDPDGSCQDTDNPDEEEEEEVGEEEGFEEAPEDETEAGDDGEPDDGMEEEGDDEGERRESENGDYQSWRLNEGNGSEHDEEDEVND